VRAAARAGARRARRRRMTTVSGRAAPPSPHLLRLADRGAQRTEAEGAEDRIHPLRDVVAEPLRAGQDGGYGSRDVGLLAVEKRNRIVHALLLACWPKKARP